ncbi:MAG: 2-enoyl thioester reductase domain-containing protein [Verrucomicrobiota bacterium]
MPENQAHSVAVALVKDYQIVRFSKFGQPEDVVHVERGTLHDELKAGQVLVKMLMASINPADINTVQGVYGLQPDLPAVPGNEGVGIIEEVGEGIANFKVGQLVKIKEGLGCWRQYIVVTEDQLFSLPQELEPEQASMLWVNPATAYRMLQDFVDLQNGDWLIQNAANSGVGRAVIQIAKAKGWKTINVVRRPELIHELKELGADWVIMDEPGFHKKIKAEFKKQGETLPKLGLNAVGGENAHSVAKSLTASGTIVTYGAMAKKPLQLANSLVIFNDLRVRGMWITQWYRNANKADIFAMLRELADLMLEGSLKISVEKIYDIAEVKEALIHAQRESRSGKILLKF